MVPLDNNGSQFFYSTTATAFYLPTDTVMNGYACTLPCPSFNIGYPPDPDFPRAPTKAVAARAAMRDFLGSVRPSDHRRPTPDLVPPPRRMFQMVHRRRCPSLGPRRPPRFSRA